MSLGGAGRAPQPALAQALHVGGQAKRVGRIRNSRRRERGADRRRARRVGAGPHGREQGENERNS